MRKLPLSDYDNWALRYWLANGKPPYLERANPFVTAMIELLNPRDFHQKETILRLLTPNMAEIFKVNPNADPPAAKVASRQTVIIPPLPAYAELTEAQCQAASSAGNWLDEFLQFARRRASMTPPLFLLSGGLWLIGLATARRAYIQVGNKLFPHLYIFWIATTTKYAKSTGLDCVKAVAQEAFPHLLLPSNSTPEALFSNLAGNAPPNIEQLNERNRNRIREGLKFHGQREILIDEATKMLNAQAKDYMAGLLELLLEAFDAPDLLEKDLKQGRLVINRLGLSILGATTPAALSLFMTYARWETGEMARYILLAPEAAEPFSTTNEAAPIPESLLNRLKALYSKLPAPPDDSTEGSQPTALAASMEPAAIDAMNLYRRAMIELSDDVPSALQGNYGRMPAQALKVALSLALIDWAGQAEGNPLVIRMGHWARAVQIAEEWRASLHRTYQDVTRSKEERLQDEIAHQMRRSPTGLTVRDLQRITRAPKAKDVQDALNVLTDAGMVTPIQGRTVLYQWVPTEN